ncbi:MAG: glycosylhydrolase-like jelly roll fold domain-containing protein [Chloroflexota bacterium]
MDTNDLHHQFINPPREFGMVPFWFWNDDLTEEELLRQVNEMYAKGFGGVLIHPRIGLSRRVGYLTEEFFRLVRAVVEECARLGMMVILYDEGSYPSGSAQGRVVAEDPSYAARCLIAHGKTVQGPAKGFWHPNPGRALNDELVCVVLAKEVAPDVLDPDSMTLLDIHHSELVQYDVPEGNWRLLAFWHVFSGGTIRGVHADEEDNHATAPAAGDILNPDAVACFIRHTHEQYANHLAAHFGTTVTSLFTDEPMVFGRRALRQGKLGGKPEEKNGSTRPGKPWPFTLGFLDDVQQGWDDDVRRWLPALWLDCGPQTEAFRQHYEHAVHVRLERVFYAAQSDWCAANGLALTGHPDASNDFGALRKFQWPGQDMVWRWVTPGSDSSMTGPHACAPKVASSAATLQGSRRNVTEVYGAYGWQMTLDEAKWLLDWHLVRGTNLIIPHAFFYSVRGRRAYESEPDIGIHNVWWPDFQHLGDYARRICWLLSDGELICDVAILTDGNAAAWSAAKLLTERQIDFVYIDEIALAQAYIEGESLIVGNQRFRAVVCDPPNQDVHPRLAAFAESGGSLLTTWDSDSLVETLDATLGQDVDWPTHPNLRAIHYAKAGKDFYFFTNEGEEPIDGPLTLRAIGAVECWDPLAGQTISWPSEQMNERTHTHLRLERRQGLILVVDSQRQPEMGLSYPPLPGQVALEVNASWQAQDATGEDVSLPCPGDWAQISGWELFAGNIHFTTSITLPSPLASQPLFLDLGQVGEIAELWINGESLGLCAWSPHVWRIDQALQEGVNQIRVRVTNSIENRYEGMQRPSGLLGPVVIRQAL